MEATSGVVSGERRYKRSWKGRSKEARVAGWTGESRA